MSNHYSVSAGFESQNCLNFPGSQFFQKALAIKETVFLCSLAQKIIIGHTCKQVVKVAFLELGIVGLWHANDSDLDSFD